MQIQLYSSAFEGHCITFDGLFIDLFLIPHHAINCITTAFAWHVWFRHQDQYTPVTPSSPLRPITMHGQQLMVVVGLRILICRMIF